MLGSNPFGEEADKGALETNCRLFNEFIKGYVVDEYDLTILATNLKEFGDGMDYFLIGLSKISDKKVAGKMRAYFNYVREENYIATSCKKCKYNNKCKHANNMYQTIYNMTQAAEGEVGIYGQSKI